MNKWLYVDFGIRIVTVIWAIFLIISPFFRLGSLVNSPVFGGVIISSLIFTALALGLLIWLYWNWSEIPVLFYLAFSTWLRNIKTVEMGGIPVDTGRLAGSIFIVFLIGGILIWQNS